MTTTTPSHQISEKRYPASENAFQLCKRYIPGGVNSPVRAFRNLKQTPLVVASGKGDTLLDVDNHSYIDYCTSWGALIHGHAHPHLTESIIKKISLGTTFGITTPIEGKLAQKINLHMPSLEKMRFVSSGTEATMSALRLARAFTGRNLLIKFEGNYHGHADPFLVQGGSGLIDTPEATSKGIPAEAIQHTLTLVYNDIEGVQLALRRLGERVAAVIVEPMAANMGLVLPEPGFLEMLREETQKTGALLIFDEVITGFRVGLSGAQGFYRITPDLTTLGKIIGGGFPAAAFGGRAEIMNLLAPDGPVYQAGTLSGNPIAMEAGYRTLELVERPGFYERLEAASCTLLDPVQALIRERALPITIQRHGSMFTFFFGVTQVTSFRKDLNRETFKEFFLFLLERGIYFSPAPYETNFLSSAHTQENLDYTRDTLLEWMMN